MQTEQVEPGKPTMRAMIEDLDLGESYSRIQRFELGKARNDTLKEVKATFRDLLSPTIARITKAHHGKRKYTVESGDFLTTSHNVVVCVLVTRVA